MDQLLKHVPDGALATASSTAPLWMQSIDHWAQFVVAIGGVILIGIRICIGLRDLRKRG